MTVTLKQQCAGMLAECYSLPPDFKPNCATQVQLPSRFTRPSFHFVCIVVSIHSEKHLPLEHLLSINSGMLITKFGWLWFRCAAMRYRKFWASKLFRS